MKRGHGCRARTEVGRQVRCYCNSPGKDGHGSKLDRSSGGGERCPVALRTYSEGTADVLDVEFERKRGVKIIATPDLYSWGMDVIFTEIRQLGEKKLYTRQGQEFGFGHTKFKMPARLHGSILNRQLDIEYGAPVIDTKWTYKVPLLPPFPSYRGLS